jgi:thiamine-phosphate pyrophosphorylase
MRGLYVIVDVASLERRGLDPVRFAEAVLSARPAAIQVRDKAGHEGGARRTLALLREIAPLARREGVPLFANDRPDLAVLAGCDGVHVGQEDVPVRLVRSVAPGLRVGLSTHEAAQVEAALEEGPDYVAIGPVFPTASKDRPAPVLGIEGLGRLAARVRAARPGLPIVAIGGISAETAAAVGAIADVAAVIGALVPVTMGETPKPPARPAGGARAYEEAAARARALHASISGQGGGR